MINNFLIFGDTGCLGSALKELIDSTSEKSSVIGLSSSCFEDPLWLNKIEYYFANTEIDAVIYAAQSRKYREYPHGIADVVSANLTYPVAIADLCKRYSVKFAYCSTGSVYANSKTPVNENSPLRAENDLNLYVASKIFAEQILLNKLSEQSILILRPFYIFGIGSKNPNLFPKLLESLAKGLDINVAQNGGLIFNPVSSGDAARAVLFLLEKSQTGIFNLGGGQITNIRSVIDILASSLELHPSTIESSQEAEIVVSDQSKILDLGFVYKGILENELRTYALKPN